jgi:hypothetical protein
LKGMGDQVIRVPIETLHSMMTGMNTEIQGWHLPRSVDIVGVIDPRGTDPWKPGEREDRWGPCVYVRIQHKYCFRRPRGVQLYIENYHDFIERFRSIAKEESNGK